MLKKTAKDFIKKALNSFEKEINFNKFDIEVEYPEKKENGFLSTNTALKLAKKIGKSPKELSSKIKEEIEENTNWKDYFEKIETAGPGFINFFVSPDYLREQVQDIIKEKQDYFSLKKKKEKLNIEYISANPTGPLTLGNGRGGFCGDVLSNILEKAGCKVTREYYINDAGTQVEKLGESVLGKGVQYKGDYIKELQKEIESDKVEKAGKEALELILKKYIKPTVDKMGIEFDKWSRESKFIKKGKKITKKLQKKGLAYERNGGIWFKSRKFGDDKDRVLIRKNGEPTYFASDIAYMKDKFKRGFETLVYFLGADHAGHVRKMKAAAEALGYKKENLNFIIVQLVDILKDGEKMKMSKREGVFITLDELIDEVGIDVARFFFIKRAAQTHFTFDFDLAKEKSKENPVYYVQYAHARISSILEKTEKIQKRIKKADLSLLEEEAELDLIKELIILKDIIKDISSDFGVHRLPYYSMDLAKSLHKFYKECRVLEDDEKLKNARLALSMAAKITLKQSLELMGVSAPKEM